MKEELIGDRTVLDRDAIFSGPELILAKALTKVKVQETIKKKQYSLKAHNVPKTSSDNIAVVRRQDLRGEDTLTSKILYKKIEKI